MSHSLPVVTFRNKSPDVWFHFPLIFLSSSSLSFESLVQSALKVRMGSLLTVAFDIASLRYCIFCLFFTWSLVTHTQVIMYTQLLFMLLCSDCRSPLLCIGHLLQLGCYYCLLRLCVPSSVPECGTDCDLGPVGLHHFQNSCAILAPDFCFP